GSDQFSIVTAPMGSTDAGLRITLPVAVSALSVRAEEAGRDQIDAIALRPVWVTGRSSRGDVARRAVRYGTTNAVFLDVRVSPEPAAFGIVGGSAASVVIAPAPPAVSVPLWLRNGALANTIAVESAGWRTDVALAAGEETRVDIPLAASGSAAVRITSA